MEQSTHDDAHGCGAATASRTCGYLSRQSSARWIPTGDQIRILRDLYYNYGLRSPSAEQIQRISAKLRQYGKIERKNVFYWFQNHKARERQKRRLTTDIRGSCFVGDGAGWSGIEPAAIPAVEWSNRWAIVGQEMSAPGRALETLPLFPTSAQDEVEEGSATAGISNYGVEKAFYCCSGGAGTGASLELTLSSFFYEPPSSV
ncbi:hypothetical protein HPP92_022167 [Vanilla planifolia]|uniref:Homeobox domain-containing protein n=1 Tax=Vanilla planifolia TaxID=51239 RepID=A0A835UDJ7_VANPL|nr:hypothetical protein HPP92_022167 [Vanilla planifolia]